LSRASLSGLCGIVHLVESPLFRNAPAERRISNWWRGLATGIFACHRRDSTRIGPIGNLLSSIDNPGWLVSCRSNRQSNLTSRSVAQFPLFYNRVVDLEFARSTKIRGPQTQVWVL